MCGLQAGIFTTQRHVGLLITPPTASTWI